MIRFVLAALVILTLAGCSKEDPIPEVRDPIFKDLEHRYEEHKKKTEELKAALEELNKSLEKTDPNTLEKRDVERDIAKNKAMFLDHDQYARYYRIRMERRRIEDRIGAHAAFVKNEQWPNPREYSDYLVNRRLVEANRNWNARVPRLSDRTPANSKAKPAKKAEGESPPAH